MRQNWIATDPGKYPSFGRDFKGFVLYRNSPGELVQVELYNYYPWDKYYKTDFAVAQVP